MKLSTSETIKLRALAGRLGITVSEALRRMMNEGYDRYVVGVQT